MGGLILAQERARAGEMKRSLQNPEGQARRALGPVMGIAATPGCAKGSSQDCQGPQVTQGGRRGWFLAHKLQSASLPKLACLRYFFSPPLPPPPLLIRQLLTHLPG